MNKIKIMIVLTAYNMGDVTERDFDAWAVWVGRHVDEACGVDAEVDQHPFRGGPADDTVTGQDDDAVVRVRDWLSHEGWNTWCAEGAPDADTRPWTYEGYWNAVLGAHRDADRVVVEYDLVGGHDLDEWLGRAEAESWATGAQEGPLPEEWTAHHARALGELRAAVERAAS